MHGTGDLPGGSRGIDLCPGEKAKQTGVTTLFNPAPPNPRLLQADVLPYVDTLTPNETEVEAITGINICQGADPNELKKRRESAIAKMVQLGVGRIAITLGADGCLVFDPELHTNVAQAELVSAPKVEPVDTTAAGDSFNAALAVGLFEGKSYIEACRWANQVASISVTRKGAQPSMPKRVEIDP